MYLQRNNEVRSWNHRCSAKAISITYSECVFVDLGIQHAMHMRRIVNYGLSGSAIFSHFINDTISEQKKNEYATCVLIFSTCLKHFPFQNELNDILP